MALQPDEFIAGIEKLAETWNRQEAQTEWANVAILRQHGTTFLRITKILSRKPQPSNVSPDRDDEDDEEAIRPPVSPPQVIYDIVHSPTYQVPVLFLTLKEHLNTCDIYESLVPEARKSEMQAVGVMGALSMTEHPVTGMTAYFVHPCRTQEAIEPWIQGHELGPAKYMMLWFGIVGGSVGLNVPVRLAEAMTGA